MIITGSLDISIFDYQLVWDISGNSPTVDITNLSTGSGLASCTWWAVIKSPTQTLIHEGSELTPDITGTWTTYNYNDNWPAPFNSLEWSGALYSFTLYVKDSAGNTYSLTKTASICRPNGNNSTSKNTFGKAKTDIQVRCQEGRVYLSDITDTSYKGLAGTRGSSILKVIYPIDQTETIPDPFVLSNFSTALVPITYSSDNYQFLVRTIYDYDLGDSVHIRIRYQQLETFSVWCNVDLMPLMCEYTKLIESVENGNCANVQEANQKLMLINPKFSMLVMGIMQPLTGINVPLLIEEIKEIGGFECDCCNAPSGIIPSTSSVIDGYSFSIVSTGGDVGGTVSTTGTNIQFNLFDKSYVFAMYPDSPQDTTAFTVTSETVGYTKTYYLKVDGIQLATDILNIIKNNGALVNLFNSIVTASGGGTGNLTVDGGCIFDSTNACDYDMVLSNIPINTTFAILSGIKIGSLNVSLNYTFNLTNLGGLQTYLNGLGYGTFAVTNPSGQTVSIISTANTTDIQSLSYRIAGTSYLAVITTECTGYAEISANEVVQNIINYLCGITDAQMITSVDYEVSYLNASGTIVVQTVTAGVSLSALLTILAETNAESINYIKTLSSVTCAAIKSAFPTNILQVTATDTLFGTKGGGACSQVSYLDAFKYMLTSGVSNADVKALFCAFVASCVQGVSCAPYDFFDVIVTEYDTTCTSIVGISYNLT